MNWYCRAVPLGAAAFGAVQTFVFNRYAGVVGMQMDKLSDLLTAGSASR